MKKFRFIICVLSGFALSACHSPQKTGNAQADSGSYGNSGATDSAAKSSFGTNASGTNLPASGSDTTTTGH